jgi:hypothetical protein
MALGVRRIVEPGKAFQAKAEKEGPDGEGQNKERDVCVLLKCSKKDFDWDLTNNQR